MLWVGAFAILVMVCSEAVVHDSDAECTSSIVLLQTEDHLIHLRGTSDVQSASHKRNRLTSIKHSGFNTRGLGPDVNIEPQIWSKKLGEAVATIMFALGFLVPVFITLFWMNERRKPKAEAVTVESRPKNVVEYDESLMHMTTEIAKGLDPVQDERFKQLRMESGCIRLLSEVEVYQWVEHVHEDTREGDKGGGVPQATEKTYTYSQTWSSTAIDSTAFFDKSYHNTVHVRDLDFGTREAVNKKVMYGDSFLLPRALVMDLDNFEDASKLVGETLHFNDYSFTKVGQYYMCPPNSSPSVGDVRARITYVLDGPTGELASKKQDLAPFWRRKLERQSLQPLQSLTYHLPRRILWSIALLTAAAMAITNFLEVSAIERAIFWKLICMFEVTDNRGLIFGIFTLIVNCMIFAFIGVSIIEFLADNCGGSGLQENRCYLNGTDLPGFFTMRTLAVRVTSSVLANAAGFPVGREGPSVVIGSNVAYVMCQLLLQPTSLAEHSVEGGANNVVSIVDEERVAQATRIACAVGGACGIATIFNSPLGGLLYMFEEVTSVSWPWELTFRAFVATTFCSLLSYFMLDYWLSQDVRSFVIFVWEPRQLYLELYPETVSWGWVDLPWFILLAASLGVVTSLHTRGCLWMAGIRRRMCFASTRWRILETVAYAGFCAGLMTSAALLSSCHSGFPEKTTLYVQLNCQTGEYNPVATLLINTSHSAVKMLFTTTDEVNDFAFVPTALSFIVYFILNIGLSGLPVPGGSFTATMLLGAMFGRCAGCFIAYQAPDRFTTAHPGVYSVVGSAAMLCGFKQMTLTVVVITVQCINNLDVAPAVMLSISISMFVNRLINEHGHDDQQIKSKKLPFLEAEVPCHLLGLCAADLCSHDEIGLQQWESFQQAQRALASHATHFPVLDGKSCLGTISSQRLQAAVEAGKDSFPAAQMANGGAVEEVKSVPIIRFMDFTPFKLEESMPVERFWKIFSKTGETAACVISDNGDFAGMISRERLLGASYK